MSALLRDLRYAARLLARAPAFTLSAVATLGLAAGLNALVFTVVNALLFRPLPVRAPEELVRIYAAVPRELMSHGPMSLADYQDLRDQCRGFSGIAASFLTTVAMEDDTSGHIVLAEVVSPDYFSLLGIGPVRGRTFGGGDAEASAGPASPFGGASTVVLSHAAWTRRFGADPDVVGRRLRLNGHAFTVEGVAPSSFFGLARGVSPEVWLPMSPRRASDPEDREGRPFWLVARLRPGVSVARARAEVEAVSRRLETAHPDTNRDRRFVVVPSGAVRVLPDLDSAVHSGSLVSLAVVALVLLVACSNVAHLLLGRALRRRREITTRLALGASRAALVRQLLAEGLLLSLMGGLVGLAIATAAPRLLAGVAGELPVDVALGVAVDPRVVLFTLAATTLTTLAFAAAPAFAATRIDVATALRQPGFGSGGGTRRLRRALLVSQLAVSFLLLVCAGLAARSVRGGHGLDLGFDPDGVVVASFAPMLQGYDARRAETLYHDLLSGIRAHPDTVAAGLASHLPLSVEVAYDRVAPLGAERPGERWPRVDSALVGPGYFEAMGIRMVRGRSFRDRDDAVSPPVVVVNESLAERLWPGSAAIGRRLRIDGIPGEHEVVGIAADGRYRTPGEAPRPFLYRAFAQGWAERSAHAGEVGTGSQTLVVRTRSSPSGALATIRGLARGADEGLAISRLTTLADATRLPFLVPRAVAGLLAVLGAVGLGLVAVGVFGLAAWSAGSRTHEIGVRLALGAGRRDVVLLLMVEAGGVVAAGLALGAVAAALTARTLSAILYGLRPLDPASYSFAALALGAVAGLASLVPARRAAGIEPQAALRHE